MPPQSNSTAHVAEWLTSHFITSFERDVDPALWPPIIENGIVHERGFFAITLLTLSYCEAMATLLTGATAHGTVEAVRFLEDEVSRHAGMAGPRYRTRGAALFVLYRHRLAHQREPGRLDIDGSVIVWEVGRNEAEANHLKFRAAAAPKFVLTIDADRLNAHALLAFKDIRDRSRTDAQLARTIYQGAVAADTPTAPQGSPTGHVGTKLRAMLAAPDP